MDAGKNQRRYWFEITWDEEQPADVQQEPVPDDEPITPTRNGAADSPARRPWPREACVDQPVASGTIATDPGASWAGNEKDWS